MGVSMAEDTHSSTFRRIPSSRRVSSMASCTKARSLGRLQRRLLRQNTAVPTR